MNRLGSQKAQKLLLAIGMAFLWSAGVRADDAAALYKAKCAGCHAADGTGTPVGNKLGTHDFHSADVQKMSDSELAGIIGSGKNKMPAYAKSLKADEIAGLVSYIRSLAGKK